MDTLDELKEFLKEHKRFLQIDYIEYFDKQIRSKLEQFSELKPLLTDFVDSLRRNENMRENGNLFSSLF